MKAHPSKGAAIMEAIPQLADIIPGMKHHHEKWEGGGYPDGLKGEEIPLLARILQMADIYDALTTARPYKPALSREDSEQIFEDEVNRGWRDPELVALFFETLNKYEGRAKAAAAAELVPEPAPAPVADAAPGNWKPKAEVFKASLENMRRELLK